MARIVYTLGELKGSVGGLTFQQNSSGKIVRQRPQVSKTSTIKQQLSHANHQNLISQYQSLTSSQKDLWNTYASLYTKKNKFGESKKLTGQNWFESVNYQKLIRSLTSFTTPPAHTIPQDSPRSEIIISGDTISINVLSAVNYAITEVNIWTTIPTTRQKPSVNQIRKFVGIITGSSDNPLDITALWESATQMTWEPLVLFPKANIFICLESVSTTSYITAPLLCTKINTQSLAETESNIYYYL